MSSHNHRIIKLSEIENRAVARGDFSIEAKAFGEVTDKDPQDAEAVLEKNLKPKDKEVKAAKYSLQQNDRKSKKKSEEFPENYNVDDSQNNSEPDLA